MELSTSDQTALAPENDAVLDRKIYEYSQGGIRNFPLLKEIHYRLLAQITNPGLQNKIDISKLAEEFTNQIINENYFEKKSETSKI